KGTLGSLKTTLLTQYQLAYGIAKNRSITHDGIIDRLYARRSRPATSNHYYRIVSFPTVPLKTEPLERIESVEVVMHCGRFVAINHIPNDWSAEIVGPVSEETKLRMKAGHGSSSLSCCNELNGFVTLLICEPSCFDISASLSVFGYD